MPVMGRVLVSSLVEPEFEDRKETLYAGIDELRERIRTEGLHQPIGVVDLGDGRNRIVWGHRRSIAVTQLGWEYIAANIHQPGEIDEKKAKVTENLHRNNLSTTEEAKLWEYLLPSDPEGTIGLARTYNVPQSRIEGLLGLLSSDPQVWSALEAGTISRAQAEAIGRFESPGYRAQAMELCIKEGMGGEALDRWRKDLVRQGVDIRNNAAVVDWINTSEFTPKVPMVTCFMGNHECPVIESKTWVLCQGHVDAIIKALEYGADIMAIEEAGYLPEYKRLVRKAEQELQNGGQPAGSSVAG
jgi:ParB/RepB/Spo0J family partition protein